jgi:hypothetical protein
MVVRAVIHQARLLEAGRPAMSRDALFEFLAANVSPKGAPASPTDDTAMSVVDSIDCQPGAAVMRAASDLLSPWMTMAMEAVLAKCAAAEPEDALGAIQEFFRGCSACAGNEAELRRHLRVIARPHAEES